MVTHHGVQFERRTEHGGGGIQANKMLQNIEECWAQWLASVEIKNILPNSETLKNDKYMLMRVPVR